jgi:hypothetical protein
MSSRPGMMDIAWMPFRIRSLVRRESCALVVLLLIACLVPAISHAAFQQPFSCQIKPGANEAPSDFEPGGLAVDQAGSLWVSDLGERTLDEFDSSCKFVGPESGPSPLDLKGSVSATEGETVGTSLAVEGLKDDFYIGGPRTTGAYAPFVEVFDKSGTLQTWQEKKFGEAYVAVDNSTEQIKDPSACGALPLAPGECIVYVAHAHPNPESPAGNGQPEGIEKFSTTGASVPFVNSKGEPVNLPYVKGNAITGDPEGAFEETRPKAIAVDGFGDIYAVDGRQVDEFRPSGEFVRKFIGEHSPGLGGSVENEGFGGPLTGVAVDPVTGVVAVSLEKFYFEEPSRDLGAVDEFDSVSGKLLGQVTAAETESQPGVRETSHLFSAPAIAFDAQGDLYVADRVQRSVDVYSPGRFVPSTRPKDVTDATSNSVELNDEIDPESILDPEKPSPSVGSCEFEYVTAEAFSSEGFLKPKMAACVPSAAQLGGNEWTEVHSSIGGLASGMTYYYRLSTSVPGTLGGTGYTEPLAFTAPHAPAIVSTNATNRSSNFADLSAKIDPFGADTSYRFEYVSAAEYEAEGYAHADQTATVDIGSGGQSGSVEADVVQHVGGLLPGTTYDFRVVAQNDVDGETETTFSENGSFRTLPVAIQGLPDGRAYELVTPAEKEGATDMFAAPVLNKEFINHDVGYVSETGQSFLLETNSAFGTNPAAISDRYVFRRDPGRGEWVYSSLASPLLGVQRISSPVFDPNEFEQVAFDDFVGSQAGEDGTHVVSLVGAPGGPYQTSALGSEAASILDSSVDTRPAGASHDLKTIVLESPSHTLAPGIKAQDAGSHALYEWNGAGECGPETGNCPVINLTPQGSIFKCGARLGQGGDSGTTHNAVSEDGTKIFFTAPDPQMRSDGTAATSGCWNGSTTNAPQLYMRSKGQSVELSAPVAGVKEAGKTPVQHAAVYVGAAADGSKVFFMSESELTEDAAKLGLHDMELYEYDTETAELNRISGGDGDGFAGNVVTVPAVSADGSAVYFTARGQLVAGLQPLHTGEIYLYRYDVSSKTTTFVAIVNEEDYPNDDVGTWVVALGLPDDVALDADANWYTTPSGNYLLFSSSRELTGNYSTASNECALPRKQDEVNGHCSELYRYDYEPKAGSEGGLACVSCDPNGAPPVSNAEFTRSAPQGLDAGPVRAMSDDGAYVFFDTADPLLARDGNGTLDVYEWHEGLISLISSGSDADPSFFLGASPDGANVFFGTHARLVPRDTDTSGDIYDARICTSSDPCFGPPVAKTAQCEGDACQNPPQSLIDTTPASLTFSGAGDVEPASPPKPRAQTRRQKLAKALSSCRHVAKRKRASCERTARKRYGAKTKKKKKRAAAKKTAIRKGSGR